MRRRRGATSTEYGLAAALIALVILGSVTALGTRAEFTFESTACLIGGGTKATCGFPRTGATCNDGTSSTATGRGACSRHGGVAEWTY